ncbi:ketosteroid isomerase-like protein [Nocardia tenerifensis]|uniref:Ketosteroid isomerase-like protein n=2 Tax=Nocardia tenerifensis TaxID=228006 RepID=A0A318JM36_9NOCA|nr:ketosteroid isomerase-like protein [Nocardia tenerifensis]
MSMRRETAEAEIRQRIDTLTEAMAAKDLGALRRLYASDVVSFDVGAPLRHVGAVAKLDKPAKAFADFENLTYEVRDLTVAVDGSVAFAYGFGRVSGTLKDGTQTEGIWVRDTFCFRKIDRDWVIVHDHVSLPMDFASGTPATDLQPDQPTHEGNTRHASVFESDC